MINILKRISVEVGAMIAIMAALFFFGLSSTAPMGVALFMYKALLFSASQVHAMIMRKIFFPYIDFSQNFLGKGVTGQQAMIIALHIVAAYVYAQGG